MTQDFMITALVTANCVNYIITGDFNIAFDDVIDKDGGNIGHINKKKVVQT